MRHDTACTDCILGCDIVGWKIRVLGGVHGPVDQAERLKFGTVMNVKSYGLIAIKKE